MRSNYQIEYHDKPSLKERDPFNHEKEVMKRGLPQYKMNASSTY